MSRMHLFATMLSHVAPSSNYRGESEDNRTVIQKVTKNGKEYAIISPESMRNALREILAGYGLPMNRRRLHNEDQLAVEFKDHPNAAVYADDFLFGYMVADNKEMKKLGRPAKRDSILRMNMALATVPYVQDATFHQSPMNAGESKWKNASTSALLHREVSTTAFQYPIAINVEDCKDHPEWARDLLRAIGELSDVAGGHARSLFEMAPCSVVVRLTPSLISEYDTYGFDNEGVFKPLNRIGKGEDGRVDLPGNEFWLGGEVVRTLPPSERARLAANGVHLFDNPRNALADVATVAFGSR